MLHDKMIYYRKKNMLTQEELAEKLCVSRQTITKWENGVITPSLEYLIDLSHIFGITMITSLKMMIVEVIHHKLPIQISLFPFLLKLKNQHTHLIKTK